MTAIDASLLARSDPAAQAPERAALKRAAEEFEALMLRQLLKSMRDTVQDGGLFDAQSLEAYQEMHDAELSRSLARRGSLGIADLVVRQLSHDPAGAAPAPLDFRRLDAPRSGPPDLPAKVAPVAPKAITRSFPASTAATPGAAVVPAGEAGSTGGDKARFVERLWPLAVRHAPAVGRSPEVLIAQAALETGWGRHLPGEGGHNLFGIKAGGSWDGAASLASTREYVAGAPRLEQARFRAYDSLEASFRDYVSLIRGTPRYADALGAGSDRDYLQAIQRGGYATDPAYAAKIERILDDPDFQAAARRLKFAERAPMTTMDHFKTRGPLVARAAQRAGEP